MNVAKEIKKKIAGFPDDYVFTASDLAIRFNDLTTAAWF